MSEEMKTGLNAYGAYALIAFLGALGSAGVALIALNKFDRLTDTGMYAIAVMVVAPAVMGVGIAAFVYKTSKIGRPGQ
jgi:hypothetical protein